MELLFAVAVVCMGTLAVARLVRVHFGRTPFPDVRGRFLLVLAFLFTPPIVVGFLSGASGLATFGSVVPYLLVLVIVVTGMAFLALVARYVAPVRSRPLFLLALVGRQVDPYDALGDPPLTVPLTEGLVAVDAANSAFPRGGEFPVQIDRPGFRDSWDALNAATETLEGRIDADRRLGIAVAARATSTAADARSRLNTLRNLARVNGQTWAT